MKKMLLPLFLQFLGPLLWAQEYRTVHCTDKCEFVVHDTLYIYHEEENGTLIKRANTGKKMGLLRFGEILSLDTTDFRGVFELAIPDFQDTDIYNLTQFLEYTRYYLGCSLGGGWSELDTFYLESSTGWISEYIRCKEHGSRRDAAVVAEGDKEEIRIDVFPIPAHDWVTLRFSMPFSGRVSVLSLSGVEQLSSQIDGKETHQVDVESLSGTYILLLYDYMGKLVKREKILVL